MSSLGARHSSGAIFLCIAEDARLESRAPSTLMQPASVARRRRSGLDRRHLPGMMADHAPAFAQSSESVGCHELSLGQDLAAYHDGKPRTPDDPFVQATHLVG